MLAQITGHNLMHGDQIQAHTQAPQPARMFEQKSAAQTLVSGQGQERDIRELQLAGGEMFSTGNQVGRQTLGISA